MTGVSEVGPLLVWWGTWSKFLPNWLVSALFPVDLCWIKLQVFNETDVSWDLPHLRQDPLWLKRWPFALADLHKLTSLVRWPQCNVGFGGFWIAELGCEPELTPHPQCPALGDMWGQVSFSPLLHSAGTRKLSLKWEGFGACFLSAQAGRTRGTGLEEHSQIHFISAPVISVKKIFLR